MSRCVIAFFQGELLKLLRSHLYDRFSMKRYFIKKFGGFRFQPRLAVLLQEEGARDRPAQVHLSVRAEDEELEAVIFSSYENTTCGNVAILITMTYVHVKK